MTGWVGRDMIGTSALVAPYIIAAPVAGTSLARGDGSFLSYISSPIGVGAWGSAMGKRSLNLVPWPTLDSTCTLLWWFSMIFFTMARPMPVPESLYVRKGAK